MTEVPTQFEVKAKAVELALYSVRATAAEVEDARRDLSQAQAAHADAISKLSEVREEFLATFPEMTPTASTTEGRLP